MFLEIVCTDRNGVRLASERVTGLTYSGTYKQRKEIIERFNVQYRDYRSVTPFVFVNVLSEN
jgi:hypothetical protein